MTITIALAHTALTQHRANSSIWLFLLDHANQHSALRDAPSKKVAASGKSRVVVVTYPRIT